MEPVGGSSLSVSFWLPPYRRPTARETIDLARAPGVWVVVHLGGSFGPRQISVLPELRREYPFAPLIGVIDRSPGSTEALTRMSRVGRAGVDAIARSGDPLGRTLRPVLTRPRNLGAEVGRWLRAVLPGLDPRVAVLIRGVVNHAPSVGGLQGVLLRVREQERTARGWLKEAKLPPLGGWIQVGRALRVVLASQRRPGSTLLSLAVGAGYHDHSSYSNQVLRLFGARPSVIRRTLGWHWWVWSFLRRRSERRLPPVDFTRGSA